MSSYNNDTALESDEIVFEDAVLNTPCSYCKLLEFDDLKQGGDIRVSKDGIPYVYFGIIEETKRNPSSGGVMGRPKISARKEFHLGYHRSDTLPRLPELAETASRGCAFCGMLRRDIKSAWKKSIRGSLNDFFVEIYHAKLTITDITYKFSGGSRVGIGGPWKMFNIRPWLDMLVVYFTVELEGGKGNQFSLSYNFHAQSSDPSATWLNVWRRPIPLGSFAATRFQRLKELIHRSLYEFPSRMEGTYLPTRLVDVGTKTSECLRLVITEQYQPLIEAKDYESRRYVALSYCWGSGKKVKRQLKTTKDTLNDHLQGIKAERLPKTLADAVRVCREIGIRYMWVDSLCIIQGDEDDWTRESFDMSKVFARCFLSLCVLRGNSCSSGFLGKRDAPKTLRINFRSTLNSSVSGGLYICMSQPPKDNLVESGSRREIPEPDTYKVGEEEINSAIWSSRGWTFQEHFLSPRKVLFGDLMFHFICGNIQESEDGSRFQDWTRLGAFALSTRDGTSTLWLPSWIMLLENYSRRHLSYKQDTLPALSALARTYSDLHPGRKYLAGLWDTDLGRGLLWTPDIEENPRSYLKNKDEYIAPSWSWACRPYSVRWVEGAMLPWDIFTKEYELLKSEIVTQEMNLFGRVYSGYLLLDAKQFRLPLNSDGRPNFSRVPKTEFMWLGVDFYCSLRSEDDEYIAYLHFDWDINGFKYSDRYPDRYPDAPMDRLSMVLLLSCRLHWKSMEWRPYLKDPEIMVGLLVMKTEGGDGFEKVGLFYSENKGLGGRKFWNDIKRREIKLI
ncbi:HET-domain-containing protein [Annulohypoxylon moriforme]|nr:HET-domain-containing protein [Annulohypoxylon moriforme]